MSASVFAFPSRGKGPQPWTNDELAELYRVVDLLGRAGLTVTTDMGMSDEGDPWFVFCRTDNDEVIAHFARIDGVFVAASIAVDETFRGANFRQIVDRMVSSQPLVMPRPTSGSKLFLHPAVMLTAFVATALAHSQKTQALDWLHAVEAQWGHSKAALLGEVRHIKTGWFDTLNTLLKLPLHEDKLTHETGKDGVMTLASIIVIALAALQPITEKIADISHLVADELSGRSANATQVAHAHAAQVALDGGGVDSAAVGAAHHDTAQAHSGADDTPQAHKMAPVMVVDGGGDVQKGIVDLSHAISIPTVQKAPVAAADDYAHAAPAPIEVQSDVNGAFMLMQQKAAAAAATSVSTAPVENFVVLSQASSSALSIGVQDVTPQALQALGLHSAKPDTTEAATDTAHASTPVGTDATPATDPGSQQLAVAPPAAVQAVTQPVNQYVDDLHSALTTIVSAISDYVNDSSHLATQAPALALSADNQQKLDSFFAQSNSQSLKVVFFDSTVASEPDMFLFSTGVVFIEEKDISANLHVTNTGGTLTMLVEGGTVTLVGVATIEHTAAV